MLTQRGDETRLINIAQGDLESSTYFGKETQPRTQNLIQLVQQYTIEGPPNINRDQKNTGQKIFPTKHAKVDINKVLVNKTSCQTGGSLKYERRITSVLQMKEFHEEYFSSRYAFVRSLGEGSSSQVKLATHLRTGEKVAVKVVNRQRMIGKRAIVQCIEREITSLAKLNHPNIANIFEVILTRLNIYIITEYTPGGELFDYIVERGRVNERDARRIFRDILKAVAYIHKKGIVHRDLKPENILLDTEGRAKLIDFGFSNRFFQHEEKLLYTHCGSPAYSAPEMLENKPYYGPEVDVWSCGVILYTLLCGKLPFDGKNYVTIYNKIIKGQYSLPPFLSEEAKSLITEMLQIDPLERITILDVRYHAWFDVDGEEFPLELTYVDDNNMIDFEVIGEMERGGFNRATSISAILNGCQNEMTTTYRLLVDRKRRSPETILGIRYTSNFRVPDGQSLLCVKNAFNEAILDEMDTSRTASCLEKSNPITSTALNQRSNMSQNASSHNGSQSKTLPVSMTSTIVTEDDVEIRGYIEHRILFVVNRTSKLHPKDILKEIRRVLRRNGISFIEEGYILTCYKFREKMLPHQPLRVPRNSLNEEYQQLQPKEEVPTKIQASHSNFIVDLQFKMEVCKISLTNRHGIRCKKSIGSNLAFNKTKKSVMSQLCL